MRFAVAFCLCLFLFNAASAQEIIPLNTATAKKIADPASYFLGYRAGADLASQGLKAEFIAQADLIAGFMDALNAKEPAVNQTEVQKAMEALGQKIDALMAAAAKENLAKANKYLDENKKKQGIQTTASGLQYEVIASGTGASPKAESTATVNYEGKLIGGKVFDSTLKADGKPATFPVGKVIPGWTEALQRMKVGDKWRLFIPPNLGYGERGAPPAGIGPNEVLIFEVELLDVK
jgi:FKBP-type peptidyl-prolyl cis-trans isomerase FklB